MKITKPAEEVDACDLCQAEKKYLQVCVVCGSEFCLMCKGTVPGCWYPPRICKRCQSRDDVIAVVDMFSDEITPIIQNRRRALARLDADCREEKAE